MLVTVGMTGILPGVIVGMPGLLPGVTVGMPGLLPGVTVGMPGLLPGVTVGMPGLLPGVTVGMPGILPGVIMGMPGFRSRYPGNLFCHREPAARFSTLAALSKIARAFVILSVLTHFDPLPQLIQIEIVPDPYPGLRPTRFNRRSRLRRDDAVCDKSCSGAPTPQASGLRYSPGARPCALASLR
ncbi:hypothetical protein [Candidatus Amarolinea dominans]|uniref:hypothetical protein n=1 Tax=Candidatus Amarolinea dominans TaxID=3140696 RepID=UPI0031CCBA59